MTSIITEDRPALAGFNAYYQTEIAPRVNAVKNNRWRILSSTRNRILAAILPITALGGALYVVHPAAGVAVLICGAIAASMFMARQRSATAHDDLKEFVQEKLSAFFDLTFDREGTYYDFVAYRHTGLVPNYDRLRVIDGLTGTRNGVHFALHELHLEARKSFRNAGGFALIDRNTQWLTVFRGTAIVIEFPKPFSGTTVVRRDKSAAGNAVEALTLPWERVRLEDPEFERHFEVYGSDQIESRYLLTPAFMERLLAMHQNLHMSFQAAFIHNEFICSVNDLKTRFAVRAWSAEAIEDQIAGIAREICFLFDMIDALQMKQPVHG